MHAFEAIAERLIAEAEARGELRGLPGEGRPVLLDDDALVPSETRMAFRLMKNAGLVPPEVEALRDMAELERMLQQDVTDEAHRDALDKLQWLSMKLSDAGLGSLGQPRQYQQRLLERLSGKP